MSPHKGKRHLKTLLSLSLVASSIMSAVAAENAVSTPVVKNSDNKNADTGDVMTVISPKIERKAGDETKITAKDMQRDGGNDFGTIMRYQPLVSATGSAGGSSVGKSGFDRGGYTGYNIRGLESNRVAIDVDGIAQPNATGRPYVGRAGQDTFGIGRDYIDPYMYGTVDIQSGATNVSYANTAIGGAVSFKPKTADDYLNASKHSYFGYQSDYDSANRSWHNGITVAGGDRDLSGIVVLSRRDGQETRNNSGTRDAYPANWHSDALMASGTWAATDTHTLTGTVDLYQKTNHTNFDSWNTAGTAINGRDYQSSETRRFSASLLDHWTPYSLLVDTIDTRVFYQRTQAHDNTYGPNTTTGSGMVRTFSDSNAHTLGFDNKMAKSWGIHEFRWGLNGNISETERPFSQSPNQSAYTYIMQPAANSRTYVFGAFAEDTMTWDLGGHNFSVVPGLRLAYQKSEPKDLSALASGSLSESELSTLYSKTSDTELLPSLAFIYDIAPKVQTYLQYKRGAQFPDASQLYGSWNLSSSYAGTAQYALIGNPNLKTETSNNYEWGIKGEATPGITFNLNAFYSQYKNFIAYTRYTRSGSPAVFTNIPSNIYTAYEAENRDKAYIYGTSLSARFNFGTWYQQVDGLSARLAFGYAKGASKSSYEGDKYVSLESVAPMKLVTGLAYDDPSKLYGMAVTATFNKGKQATPTNRESYTNTGGNLGSSSTEYARIPGYGIVDLTGYVQVAQNVKISGGIYNVTDRKYWDYLSTRDTETSTAQDKSDLALATMPGRTFQLGVNVDF
ncbi:TonB-dependent receptor domain-containing protein [Serratia sp. M24T3]|uniref:TonB-dependent receptor domain-containing protein n=1 Tax=Serratia sp. M24T3 TaxID=932213 RepID=UPI00025BC476|nr:TonB-dependent receptor [Serratia sp. M24T3]EIC82562.1 outer membrane receptor for ferrienterochelin and colicins [Serratia sp. M24T3]